jgi:MoaA/NifB/PqqE/SkfB family radical SAM enzyme
MYHTLKHPSGRAQEVRAEHLVGLPQPTRLNITDGKPFLRKDPSDILAVVKEKANRAVISSEGFSPKKSLTL